MALTTSQNCWSITKPANPHIGDCFIDLAGGKSYVWTGGSWAEIQDGSRMVPEAALMAPSKENLEKHPALKEAWENYLIVKKLLGV